MGGCAWVDDTSVLILCSFTWAAILIAVLHCSCSWRPQKGCQYIAIPRFVLALVGLGDLVLGDFEFYDDSVISPIFGKDLSSTGQAILILEVVTYSIYIISSVLLFWGVR